jgi:PAS domain S-box-containing protein
VNGKPYVLIADDKEENLLYLNTLLNGNAFAVGSAHNGIEALAMARINPPILIISDLLMPVMDGYTLLRHWKTDPRLMNVPFIVYTSTYTESEDERLAFNLGADAFLSKPAEPAELMGSVRKVLESPVRTAKRDALTAGVRGTEHLQQYSETLIRKLEEKSHQLEESNRALQESRGQYLLLLNSTAEGIYGLDADGVCTFCNPAAARLLGYANPGEIVGQTAHDQHHHSHEDGAPYSKSDCRVHRGYLEGSGSHSDDEFFFHKDGSKFPVEYWSYPIRRHGTVVGAVVTFLDISERRDLEAQFLQSQKMEAIGRLAGGVAHDFNNALQVILICSELLADRVADSKEQSGYVAEIQSAGQRAATLTRQLLTFSRRQIMRPVVLNLNSVVEGIKEMLRRLIGEDVSLAIFYDYSVLPIESDVGQIEQILMNLAVNARDAMEQGGELVISTSNVTIGPALAGLHPMMEPGRYVMLSIRDTGCGMDAATRERIFEPFFTTKDPGKGTGLGLSTVYGIVQQCDGFIHVISEVGHGTTFEVYFPPASGPVAMNLPRPAVQQVPRGSECILLVEDEESLRSLVSDALRRHGYQVMEACDGMSGIELGMRGQMVDMLLTDVILPDISGPQVADKLQAMHPGIKVLYMSGYSDDYVSKNAILDSEKVLLEKPFTIGALLSKVREMLGT